MTAPQLHILAYPGASQAAVLGMAEMFDCADQFCRETGGTGLRIHTSSKPPETSPATLILPPTYGNMRYLRPDPAIVSWLRKYHQNGGTIASACAGVAYIGSAGLLENCRITTHWRLESMIHSRFPEARLDLNQILIRDGRIISAGGLMSWTDLALELIGIHTSQATLHQVGRYFVLDTGRREQRFYRAFQPRFDHGDAAIADAQRYLQDQYPAPIRIRDLAHKTTLTERSFLRRFKRATGLTPLAYLQHLRVFEAQLRLESSADSIAQIAHAVGYENTNAFYKIFHRLVGLTPGEYRQRLGR